MNRKADFIEWIREHLAGTTAGEHMLMLHELYRDVDDSIGRWTEAAGFPGCRQGCGTCCSTFHPDISRLEADYAAAQFLFRRGVNSPLMDVSDSACPFFRETNTWFCSNYEGRPLICRTFGFTTCPDREGRPRMQFCRELSYKGRRTFTGEDLEAFPILPPMVTDFGVRLSALDPGNELETISRAVPRSLERLRSMIEWNRPEPTNPPRPRVA
jgi:Fe-S-cluster containining protein